MGIMAPSHLPPATLKLPNRELNAGLSHEAVRKTLHNTGTQVIDGEPSAQRFKAFSEGESLKRAQAVRKAAISVAD